MVEVPEELQFYIAPALETGDLDEALLGWLVNEDLLTSEGGAGWSAASGAAGLPEAGWWSLGTIYRVDDELHVRIDQAREDAALEVVGFVFKQGFGAGRVKLHLNWGGAFPGRGAARADRRRVLAPGRAAPAGDRLRADARRRRGDRRPRRLPRRLRLPGAAALRQLSGSRRGSTPTCPAGRGDLGGRGGGAPAARGLGRPADRPLRARPRPSPRPLGVGQADRRPPAGRHWCWRTRRSATARRAPAAGWRSATTCCRSATRWPTSSPPSACRSTSSR